MNACTFVQWKSWMNQVDWDNAKEKHPLGKSPKNNAKAGGAILT